MPEKTAAPRTPLKQVEFLILAALFDEPRHGYGIVQQIETSTSGQVSLRPGDVYRVLYRLGERGFLQETAGPASEAATERRTYYALTDLGRDLARQEAKMLAGVAAPLMSKAGQGGGR